MVPVKAMPEARDTSAREPDDGDELRAVEAAVDILREGSELTFSEVARKSGIAERTLYRRFRSKAELERAIWTRISTAFGNARMPQTLEELLAQVRAVFPAFDRDALLVRAMLRSPDGHEVRMRANAVRRAGFLAIVDDEAPGLPARDRLATAAALQVLFSGPTWQMLRDFWELDGHAAADVVVTSVLHVVKGARQTTAERRRQKKARGR